MMSPLQPSKSFLFHTSHFSKKYTKVEDQFMDYYNMVQSFKLVGGEEFGLFFLNMSTKVALYKFNVRIGSFQSSFVKTPNSAAFDIKSAMAGLMGNGFTLVIPLSGWLLKPGKSVAGGKDEDYYAHQQLLIVRKQEETRKFEIFDPNDLAYQGKFRLANHILSEGKIMAEKLGVKEVTILYGAHHHRDRCFSLSMMQLHHLFVSGYNKDFMTVQSIHSITPKGGKFLKHFIKNSHIIKPFVN